MKIETAPIMEGPPAARPAPTGSARPAPPSGDLFAAVLDQTAAVACAPVVDSPGQTAAGDEAIGIGPVPGGDTDQPQPAANAPAAIFACTATTTVFCGEPDPQADCAPSMEVRPAEARATRRASALHEQVPESPAPKIAGAEGAEPPGFERVRIARNEDPARMPVPLAAIPAGAPANEESAFVAVVDETIPRRIERLLRTFSGDGPMPSGGFAPKRARVSAQKWADTGAEVSPESDCRPFPSAVRGGHEQPAGRAAAHCEGFYPSPAVPAVQCASRRAPAASIVFAADDGTAPPASGSAGRQRPAGETAQTAGKTAEIEWILGLLQPAPGPAPAAASHASRVQPAILVPGLACETAPAVPASALPGTGRPSLHAQAEIAFSEIDFLARVAEQIQLRIRDGSNVIRVQLRPGDLGRMEIRAECSATFMNATILTESPWVRSYVEQNLSVLYQNLQDLGVKVDRLVVLEDAWARHPSAQQGNHGAGPQDECKRELHPYYRPEPEGSPAEGAAGLAASIYILPGRYSTFHAVA